MNERLARALRREPVDATPVWFMRQAGRCLPRYREMRAERGIAELIADPAAAAEVTAMPLDYFDVDAAVLFMDLSTPFVGAGLGVRFDPGVGPVIVSGFDGPADADRLRPFEPRDTLGFVLETIRLVRGRLDVPVIGFVGGVFTLISYMLPGSRAARLQALRTLLWQEPATWDRLASYWTDQLAEFAIAQAEAGAGAIQLFDSWAGVLSPEDYDTHVLDHSRRLLSRLSEAGVPTIHFATGNPALLPSLARAGGDAIGIDWRVPLDQGWSSIGHDRAVQGNLDPTKLLAGEEEAVRSARAVLAKAGGRPGHVFNVGHGLLPETDPAVVSAVVDAVHEGV